MTHKIPEDFLDRKVAPWHGIAYTKNKQINIPENKITEDKPEYNYAPLRGHGFIMAVFDLEDKCIGYIEIGTLGYNSVKEWMSKSGYKEETDQY